jgi:hypothetical protein
VYHYQETPISHQAVRRFQTDLLAARLMDNATGLFEWDARSNSWERVTLPFVVAGHRHDSSGRTRGTYLVFKSFIDGRERGIDLPDTALRDAARLAFRLRNAGLAVEPDRVESLMTFLRICKAVFGRIIWYQVSSQEPGQQQLAA